MQKLLILDNAIYPDIYHPVDHWIRHVPEDFEVTIVRLGEALPRAVGFSHILITGSEASITKPDPWVEDQIALIQDAVKARLPLLGSCHAHQMIAAALGSPELVRSSPTPEFGWVEIEILEENGLFTGAKRPAWAFCSHFDEVVSLPQGCELLARSARCTIQAFRGIDAPVFGIQAHPEINPQEGEQLIADFLPRFPSMAAHPILRPPKDSGLVETMMGNFLGCSREFE